MNLAGEEIRGGPFVLGDTNLNGTVEATDLNSLALNWLSTDDSLSWSGGDFNGDHTVDATDLNELALNWLHGAASEGVRTVPEPETIFMALAGLISVRRTYS